MTYREVFFAANGFGPWPCWFCGKLVLPKQLQVHHLDGNRKNKMSDNLAPSHKPCHQSFHGDIYLRILRGRGKSVLPFDSYERTISCLYPAQEKGVVNGQS